MRGSRVTAVTAVATVALLALTSAGCVRSERGLAAAANADCPLDALDKADGVVELELWHALNAEAKTTLENLAEDFNRSQDKVKVDVRSQGTTYGEILEAYSQGIAAGQLPGIAHMDAKDLRYLIDTATLLPAQSCFDAEGVEPQVIPSVRSAFTVNETYWPSLPTVSSSVLYYSKSDFQRAGLDPEAPPGTLAEVKKAAQALKKAGVDKPLALLLANGFVETWVLGAGVEMVNRNDGRDGLATTSNFDNPATHEVFEWIKDMVDSGLAEPFSTGGVDQFLAVATRKSSMLIETSTASTTIAKFVGGETVDTGGVDSPDLDLSKLNPASGPFPGLDAPGRVEIGGGAFFIPGTNPPEVQAAAWEFSKYMASKESQIRWHTEGSYLPIRTGLDQDPTLRKFWDTTLAGQLLAVAVEQTNRIDPEHPGPIVGPTTDYAKAIESAMGKVAFQGGDVDRAIATAQRQIDEALADYAESNG